MNEKNALLALYKMFLLWLEFPMNCKEADMAYDSFETTEKVLSEMIGWKRVGVISNHAKYLARRNTYSFMTKNDMHSSINLKGIYDSFIVR